MGVATEASSQQIIDNTGTVSFVARQPGKGFELASV